MGITFDLCQAAAQNPGVIYFYLRRRWRLLTQEFDHHWRSNGFSGPPLAVSLRPTFLCNLNCRMCSFANSALASGEAPITSERDFLPLEVGMRLLDDVSAYPVVLSITGGEPFLWPDLFGFLDHAKKRRVFTTITTNGTLLAHRAEQIMAAPPNVIIVSVLGDRDTHDAIVGRAGMYDTIVEGLEAIHAAKESRRHKPPLLIINTPILIDNADTCHLVLELGKKMPVLLNHFQHLWFVTPEMREGLAEIGHDFNANYTETIAVDTESIDPDVIWACLERIRANAGPVRPIFYPDLTREELHTYYTDPSQLIGRDHAICAWMFTHVLPNGDVSPCLGAIVGNIQQQSFSEIWNGPRVREFRQMLLKRKSLPICPRCCVWFRNQ